MYIYMYIYPSLSLSLSLYIYIYTHIHTYFRIVHGPALAATSQSSPRHGRPGFGVDYRPMYVYIYNIYIYIYIYIYHIIYIYIYDILELFSCMAIGCLGFGVDLTRHTLVKVEDIYIYICKVEDIDI